MADPYNPYTSYSTPTPGGVGYYPPDEQTHQQQYPPQDQYQQQRYNTTEPQHEPNYAYPPPQNPYLAGEHYQPDNRSYTPVGQPDALGPITSAPQNPGKIPENASY